MQRKLFFLFITLITPVLLFSAEQNLFTESYDLRISGISTRRDGSLQIYGIVKPYSGEAPALNYCPPEQTVANDLAATWSEQVYEAVEKALPPKSREFKLETLRVGDCYKNICFYGLSEDGKEIIITYKKNGEWDWGAVPAKSLDTIFAIDMDPIVGTRQSLQIALDQWHELFPDNFMPSYVTFSAGSGTGFYQKGLKFAEGRFTVAYAIDKKNPPPNLNQIFANLKSKYKIVSIDGIPTIEEPVESCEEFRKSLTGGHIYASELLSLTYRIAVPCKNGSEIGYCNADTFNPGVSGARCESQEKLPETNECGGAKNENSSDMVIDYGLTRNNLLNVSIMGKNGSACTVQSQDIFVTIYPRDGNPDQPKSSGSFMTEIDQGFYTAGVCYGGQCISDEVKTCRIGSTSIHVSFYEDEFETNFGREALALARSDDRHKVSKVFPQFGKFLENEGNRKKFSGYRQNAGNNYLSKYKEENGTVCPGGICQNGECIPFQQFLGGSGSSLACRNLENGNPCEFLTKNSTEQGFCYESECYLCDPNLPERLVGAPACPENPAYPGVVGYRRSCNTPDVCSYL